MKNLYALLLFVPLFAHAAIDPVVDAADHRQPEAEALTQAASSHLAKRRALAARAWGEIMSPKGIDPLLKLAQDPMPFVRAEAVFALGQLGWLKDSAGGRETEIQNKLAALLRDKQGEVRVAAAEALGKIGLDRAGELLSPALSSREPAVRSASLLALFRARMILKQRDPDHAPGALPEALLSQMLSLATDSNAAVRRNVAYFFARNAEPKAEPAMGALATDRDDDVRLFAVMALAKMKAKSSKAHLETALRDKSYTVRVAAVQALASAGESLYPYAAALQQDKTFHVRAAFADGLKADDLPQLAILLALLQNDESPTVRAEALKAVAKTKGAQLETFLRQQISSPDWQIAEAAVQSADPLEAGAKEKFLLDTLAANQNRLVRAAALDALFALPTPAAFDQLKKSLDSPELSERATAVGDLGGRKESGVAALAEKTYQASLEPKWVETREDLLDVFAKTNDDASNTFLKQALQDPDRGVRAKARQLLQGRGVSDLPQYPDPDLTYSPFRADTFRKNPLVEIQTNKGNFTVECFAKEAPIHVADFVGHVKAGFYEGLPWHRVISNFVVQGGDPDGTGFGGAGYALRAEINRKLFTRGALGMPRSQGFDTGGGQLFFSHIPTPHLDGQYTVFGRIVEGEAVIDSLERGDRIVHAVLRAR
jgi:cyclophilin family peptidyl-prolyl cis-trans isomerase/HEAT repeat protein